MEWCVITNEFILQDRLQKIKQIINQYGEENFYLSFSGGKDSTVLSKLVDIAYQRIRFLECIPIQGLN